MADESNDSSDSVLYFGGKIGAPIDREALDHGATPAGVTRLENGRPGASLSVMQDLAGFAAPLLFVGRKRSGAQLGLLLEELQRRQRVGQGLGLLAATSQKQAQRLLRALAPLCVLLEIDAKPNSRARFGQILRHRLSDTRLVAVGAQPPTGSFAFDDYLEAPITAGSLISLIGRAQMGNNSHVTQHGPIRLDLVTRTVVTPRGRHRMTPKQCALLQMLLDNHDQVVSRRDIMQTIWETSFMEDTRTLDVHIRWLRERIEPDPSAPIYLRTVRGQGYHLCLEGF